MKAKNFIPFRYRNRSGKYNAKSTMADGINFHSMKEANYYGQLKIEKRAKLIKSFDRQVSFDLYAWSPTKEKLKVCCHIVDFVVELSDGTKECREVKGFATSTWDLKRKLFESNFPDIPYKVIR